MNGQSAGRPLRVVHVTEAISGGVMVWLVDVSAELERRGWDQTLVYDARQSPEVSAPQHMGLPTGVRLVAADMKRTFRPLHVWRSARKLADHFLKTKPGVIHLHSSIAGGVGRLAARLAGMQDRVVYSPHGLAFLREDVSWLARAVFWMWEWAGARLGGRGVACSRGEYDAMSSLFPAGRLHLIENAVKVDTVPEVKVRDDGLSVIGCSGRLAAQKAPEVFARIAAAIPRDVARFVWIGGGDEDKRAVLEAAEVSVTGWVSRQEAVERMCGLDVYLSTARWEGMPLALIEAQIAGIPAVVSDVVGNRDVVVHGETGFVGAGFEEFVGYVRELALNRAMRQRLGRQARRKALERFDVRRLVDSLEALYRKVAADGR